MFDNRSPPRGKDHVPCDHQCGIRFRPRVPRPALVVLPKADRTRVLPSFALHALVMLLSIADRVW